MANANRKELFYCGNCHKIKETINEKVNDIKNSVHEIYAIKLNDPIFPVRIRLSLEKIQNALRDME